MAVPYEGQIHPGNPTGRGGEGFLTHTAACELLAERDRLREALAYLADPESWGGDPLSHDAVLYGHDTPYELAVTALGDKQ